MARSLFLVHTPYHLLLAFALAAEAREHAPELLVIPDAPNLEALTRALLAWEGNPFTRVEWLTGRISGTPWKAMVRGNIAWLRRDIPQAPVAAMHIFNDERWEGQAALAYVKHNNPQAARVYVEDGMAAYTTATLPQTVTMSWWRGVRERLRYGFQVQAITHMGGSPLVAQCRATFPARVRPELRRLPVTGIVPDALRALGASPALRDYLRQQGVADDLMASVDGILVMPHSEDVQQDTRYRAVFERLVALAQARHLRLAVKYHPRETAGDFLGIEALGLGTSLPFGLPLELIPLCYPDHDFLFIGDVSTALLTSRWLVPASRVLSLAPLFGLGDPWMLDVFRAEGITVVEQVDALDAALPVTC